MRIHSNPKPKAACLFLTLCAVVAWAATPALAAVSVEQLPESGLQPQTVAQPDGTVHLIYLTGDPKSADVVYRRRRIDETEWSGPLPVNSQPGSAVAIGTIRGPQLALGRGGRVHVAWNGSQSAEPKPAHGGSPMLYACLNDEGKGFSTQKNLMTASHQLDGGGSVAADADGRVFVVWHASHAGMQGETNRAVFLALSADDGRTFTTEQRVSPPGAGACGCCGLTAFAKARGEVFVLFRTARSAMQRDMMLLVSPDHGAGFRELLTHPWSVGTCPMSSASLTAEDAGTWAAWETAGRIHLAQLSEAEENEPRAVGPRRGAKHPRLATNTRGETLVVWTEGTGWQRGGSMAWQLFNDKGEPMGAPGKSDGIPVWSYAAVYARPSGDFVILQ